MNLRMIGKIYKHDDRLTQFASMTSKTNLRSNQSNDLFSAFRLLSFLGYFLCLLIFSACMPAVRSVCLFNIFLLLFSNKMKSCFCFIVARNNLTSHTAKYRMNDVTMIYRIVLHILI